MRLNTRDPLLAIYHDIAAYVQFVGRDYDEAIQLARKAARENCDILPTSRAKVHDDEISLTKSHWASTSLVEEAAGHFNCPIIFSVFEHVSLM